MEYSWVGDVIVIKGGKGRIVMSQKMSVSFPTAMIMAGVTAEDSAIANMDGQVL